jgi:nicotinamidase-related amidase
MTHATMDNLPLRASSLEFLDYLDAWRAALIPMSLAEIVEQAGGPEHVGLFCVDVINGFCHTGPLASPRVRAIITPIVGLFTAADTAGIRHFVLMHDAHDPDAAEFADYPPHCIRGTEESVIVPELEALPFASRYTVIPKNSIHSGVGTELNPWLDAHPEITHRIVVGDVTDLCAYQLAMHLKVRANAANRTDPVILPANCVDTFDIPVATARAAGIPAHPAEIFHTLYLYSMACNGIRVVRQVD